LEQASADFIAVIYLPSDPARNHPADMVWEADDEIFGCVIGLLLLQIALLLFSLSVRELVFGPEE